MTNPSWNVYTSSNNWQLWKQGVSIHLNICQVCQMRQNYLSWKTRIELTVLLLFPENEEALFNPWCPTFILTDAIRKKCNCESNSSYHSFFNMHKLLNDQKVMYYQFQKMKNSTLPFYDSHKLLNRINWWSLFSPL